MLKRFEAKNYRNFKDPIIIDFSQVGNYQFNRDCINGGNIAKMLIYGRNATGKTNLGRGILDISSLLDNYRISRQESGLLLNADSKTNVAELCYIFQFGNDEIAYKYQRFSENRLRDEELFLNGDRVFYNNLYEGTIDVDGLALVGAETVSVARYVNNLGAKNSLGTYEYEIPFLVWLIANSSLNEESVLLKLSRYVNGMKMVSVMSSIRVSLAQNEMFLDYLNDGDNLSDFEDFLNVMGVECRLALKNLPDGSKQLYFVHDRLIPFYETASSGTRNLAILYMRIFMYKDVSLLYLDEFDAFYHYEMAENLVNYFKKRYTDCQVIMTSHNTNLMTNRIMRPDTLFILSRSGKLTAICNATERELREGHNLEKMYISGEFEKYE